MALFAGVRSRLVLLAFALTAPTVCLQLWRAADERHEAIERARSRVAELARAAAAEEDDSLQEAANLLRVLKHVPVIAESVQGECHGLLREITNEHPRIDVVSVTRPDGSIACSSWQPVPPSHGLGDRTWFQEATASNAPATVISELLISRSSGLPSVIVASGLAPSAADGSRGAVSAAMKLAWFANTSGGPSGPGGVLTTILNAKNGTVLARSTDAEDWIGKQFPDHPLLQSFRSAREGILEVADFDGTPRIVAFTRLAGDQNSQAVVSVGVSRASVLAEANRHLFDGLAATALTLVLGMAVAWAMAAVSILRPLDALGRVATRLGSGDLTARAPKYRNSVNELQKLGELINCAAGQIELRDFKLEQLALRDGLTGLANRRSFDAALAKEWLRGMRTGRPVALVMIDVDYFKRYNDAYGHPAGDACLQQVASAIAAAARASSDVVARYGGEEIAVVIPDVDIAGASSMAKRIVDEIRGLDLPHSASPFGRVTVSAGVAAITPCNGGQGSQSLTDAADQALYTAKGTGRDRVATAPSDTMAAACLR